MIYKIYADDKLLYATNEGDSDYQLSGVTLDVEMGKAGGASFTVPPSHPLYSQLKNQLSIARIEEDDEILFRGRLFDSTSDFFNQKQWQSEGDLNFLSDSCVPKVEVKESIKKLFTRYINEHNSRVEDYKKFTVGNITIDNADTEEVDVKYTSYRYTLDAIQNDLIDSYGGYLRTRIVNGTTYIDYLKEYNSIAKQTIEFGVNLVDLSNYVSPEDLFTVLIPIGDNDLTISSVNNGKDYLEVDGGVSKWGKIYRLESFSGIDDANTLLKEANLFIKNHYDGSPQTITLTAIDMKHLGVDSKSIRVGDKVRILSAPHGIDKDYTCVSISYNISVPGKTQYTFGRPKQDFTKKYNKNSKDTQNAIDDGIRRVGGAGAATADKLDKYIIANDQELLLIHDNIKLQGQNIDLLAQSMNDGFNTVQINLDAVNARLDLSATKEYVDGELNDVAIALDAANARLDLTATKVYVDGQIDQVSISLDAANRRIDINAQDIVEINSDITKINGDLVVLGKTITDEITAMKGDISWLSTKTISAVGIKADYATLGGLVVNGNTTTDGLITNKLQFNGSSVSKTTLPVVTSFTQASGSTAPTTNYTFMTTSVGNGVARSPNSGDTITFSW